MGRDDDALDWNGAAPPPSRPGGMVSGVGLNAKADLAIDPEAPPSTPAPRGGSGAGPALQVERLGPPRDPAQPRPSGRVRLKPT